MVDLNHSEMTQELNKQIVEICQHEGRESVVRSVLQVASPLDPTVSWGIHGI